MHEIKLLIIGEPRSKKNSMQIVYNKRTGRPFLIQSNLYRAYEQDAKFQLAEQFRGMAIDSPVNVKATFYRSKKIRVDLANLEEALLDILVAAGVLADDFFGIVASMDGSRIDFDKANPRTEITITEAEL